MTSSIYQTNFDIRNDWFHNFLFVDKSVLAKIYFSTDTYVFECTGPDTVVVVYALYPCGAKTCY